MKMKISLAMLALAMGAVPAAAQISTTDRVRDRVILGGERSGTQRTGGVGDIIRGRSDARNDDEDSDERRSRRVPPGHRPPRGMCRVWIDGVPPGRQPAPTSCANAQRDRVQYGANARVIYGDDESRPGKGRGRYKNRDEGTTDIFGRRTATARTEANAKVQKASGSAKVNAKGSAAAKAKGKGKG